MPDLSLDLRYLKCVLLAAEHDSFRRAAAALDLPQSTVSRRILLLEHRIGFSLFVRDRRGVTLTVAGADFLKQAVVAAWQLDRAARFALEIHRGHRGELNVGILASLAGGFLHDPADTAWEITSAGGKQAGTLMGEDPLFAGVAQRAIAGITLGYPLNLCRPCNVLDPSPPSRRSRIEVDVLILSVLTVLYLRARFDVCGLCLTAKRPIDADSSQNFFCPEILKTLVKSRG